MNTSRLVPLAMALVAVSILVGCGSSSSSSTTTTTAAGVSASAQRKPVPAGPPLQPGTPLGVKGHLSDHTAIADANWADPFAFVDGGSIYTYATNTSGANVPVAQTDDGQTYVYKGDAMATLASWTHAGAVWAPSVYRRSDGTYVMFYDSSYGITPLQCIGVATSSSPTGPFVDSNKTPLVCPNDTGAIDASMLVVDGTPYLLFKSDGNCCQQPTSIWSQQLSSDWTTLVGQPNKLITNDQAWEGDVVEAPTMVKVGDAYYLFYSGNDWGTQNYAIGYAVCSSITGPCTKPLTTAWGPSFSGFQGPGGASFLTTTNDVDLGALAVGSKAVMVFHGWPKGQVDPKDGSRELFVSIVEFDANGPRFVAVP